MRILVTGADGFVGQHLVRELGSRHRVIAVDLPQGDLAQPGIAARLIHRHRPNYVVHLAARYGRLLCRDEPHRAVTDNAAATTELAAVCALQNIPVLYTSSSEVYGDHDGDQITERSELRTPTTIYGLSKRWGEEALQLYLDPGQLCIVRMNMLYGPGQLGGYGRCALATFILNALQSRPLIVHRGASRSWLYIDDAVRALRLLIEGGHAGIFNLSNDGEVVPMMHLARLVIASTEASTMNQVRTAIQVVEPPTMQIRHKNYDSTKLRRAINWKPTVGLGDGIALTVEAQRVVLARKEAA